MAGPVIETLAPFYGVDPEIQENREIQEPPRESAAWLRSALDAAEERARDLEVELAEAEAPIADGGPGAVREWILADRERIDREKKTGLDWAYEIVLGRLEELGA